MKSKKKITWFVLNPESVLQNAVIRTANTILLCMVSASAFAWLLDDPIGIEAKGLGVFSVLLTTVIFILVFRYVIKNTHFYVWDKRERKKKESFTLIYATFCVFLSGMLANCITNLIAVIMYEHESGFIVIYIIGILYMFFNLCNIPSLFYPIFETDLTRSSCIKEKPDDW